MFGTNIMGCRAHFCICLRIKVKIDKSPISLHLKNSGQFWKLQKEVLVKCILEGLNCWGNWDMVHLNTGVKETWFCMHALDNTYFSTSKFPSFFLLECSWDEELAEAHDTIKQTFTCEPKWEITAETRPPATFNLVHWNLSHTGRNSGPRFQCWTTT